MDLKDFESKKIKCVWCNSYVNKKCFEKGVYVKARKPRRCTMFSPNETALDKEACRGDGIETIKMPSWAWDKKERKRMLKLYEVTKDQQQVKMEPNHPLTGDLSRFRTTAE